MPTPPTTSDDLLAQAAQAAADAIFCVDLDGRITAWNAGAERLYGLPAAQALGSAVEQLAAERDRSALAQALGTARAGTRVERFDSWHRRRDGSDVPVSVTIAPLHDRSGSVCGTATSAVDITERVELDLALQDAQRELERQNSVLVRSNRDLEQFAYVASHDLSEPLRVISGFVTQLERRYGDAFDERGSRYLRHIVEGAGRMRALIDDLLEYSRFLRTAHEAADVPLDDVVQAALARLAQQVEETGARVDVTALPVVRGDRSQLQSMVQNLVANALKFTPPGVAPHVAVSGAVEDGTAVLLVDDAGIGIPAEFRERVFRMFQRLHVREDYSGTGIGLAIVQQVVELHGGSIGIDDSPLGGTRFRVALPLTPGGAHGGDAR